MNQPYSALQGPSGGSNQCDQGWEKIIGHLPRTPMGTKGTVGHQFREPFPLTLDCHLETPGSYILALDCLAEADETISMSTR